MSTIGRQREKEHAASHVRAEADRLIVERVVDAVHDIVEGVSSPKAVAPVLVEAFVTGGAGAWDQTGSWMRKLAREHSSLHQLWLQLARHKSARIRFRVAAFLNDMPDIRQQLAATFLSDPSAKVRSKTAGEISMRPTPNMLPLCRDVPRRRQTQTLSVLSRMHSQFIPELPPHKKNSARLLAVVAGLGVIMLPEALHASHTIFNNSCRGSRGL